MKRDLLAKIAVEGNVLKTVEDLKRRIERLEQREVMADAADEITDDLGEVQAGTVVGWNLQEGELVSEDEVAKINSAVPFFSLGATGWKEGTGIWMGRHEGKFKVYFGNVLTGEFIAFDGTTWETPGIVTEMADIKKLVRVGENAPFIEIDGREIYKEIRSSDFVAGLRGLLLKASGKAEFNDVTVRGEIRASVFSKGEVTVTAGTVIVSKGGGKLLADCNTLVAPNLFNVDIESPSSGHTTIAAVGDILRLARGITNNWIEVTAVSNQTTFYRYVCTLRNGSPTAWTAGTTVINYGKANDGFLLMTADDTNAPYYSVRHHKGSPWIDTHETLRLGSLSGITGLENKLGLAGMNQDSIPQFYIDTDGKASFVGGQGVIDDSGINISNPIFAYDQSGHFNPDLQTGFKQMLFGMFKSPRTQTALVGGLRFSGKFRKFIMGTPIEQQGLGTNRGFELNNLTQFTTGGSGSSTVTIVTTPVYEGVYSADLRVQFNPPSNNTVTRELYLYSASVPVIAGTPIRVSVAVRHIEHYVVYVYNAWRNYSSSIEYHNASGGLVSSRVLSSTLPGTTWRVDEGSDTIPAEATTARLCVYINASGRRDASHDSGTVRYRIATDLFSIITSTPGSGDGQWTEQDSSNYLYLDQSPMILTPEGRENRLLAGNVSVLAPLALTATVTGTAGNVNVGTHRYRVVFGDEMGNTEGGTHTEINVTTSPKTVNLTSIPIGRWETRTRRIYRTAANTTSPYKFLTEIMDNATTSWTDNVADANLGINLRDVNTSGSRPIFPARQTMFWVNPGGAVQTTTHITSQRYCFHTNQSSPANLATTFVTTFLERGTYTIHFLFVRNTTYGRYDLYLDNVLILGQLEGYAAALTYNVMQTIINVVVPQSGLVVLSVQVNGRHASATSWNWGFTSATFVRNNE